MHLRGGFRTELQLVAWHGGARKEGALGGRRQRRRRQQRRQQNRGTHLHPAAVFWPAMPACAPPWLESACVCLAHEWVTGRLCPLFEAPATR